MSDSLDGVRVQPVWQEPTITKCCPECGYALVIRSRIMGGLEFLGCTRYPSCVFVMPLPLDIVLRRAGRPTLFGGGE